jgi:hypothetical protein
MEKTTALFGRPHKAKLRNVIRGISKKWVRVQGKARGGEKTEHTRQYVSILSRPATPQWVLRRFLR